MMMSLCIAAGVLAVAQNAQPSNSATAHPGTETATHMMGGVILYTDLTPTQKKIFRTVILPSLQKKTYNAWLPLIPEEARTPQAKSGSVQIDFTIAPDGHAKLLQLQKPSGDIALDRAAWGAITGAQYAAFPQGFDLPGIHMAITFNYNQPEPQGRMTSPRQ
jgi:TonB family protein